MKTEQEIEDMIRQVYVIKGPSAENDVIPFVAVTLATIAALRWVLGMGDMSPAETIEAALQRERQPEEVLQ